MDFVVAPTGGKKSALLTFQTNNLTCADPRLLRTSLLRRARLERVVLDRARPARAAGGRGASLASRQTRWMDGLCSLRSAMQSAWKPPVVRLPRLRAPDFALPLSASPCAHLCVHRRAKRARVCVVYVRGGVWGGGVSVMRSSI